MKRLLIQGAWGLLIATLTVAGYAQFSNPADDVPAYNSQPPAKGLFPLPMAGQGLQGGGEHPASPFSIAVLLPL
jgi:hypothetical protein